MALSLKRAGVAPVARRTMAPVPVRMAVVPRAVLDDVRSIVAEQLGKDLADVKPTSDFVTDLAADSLDIVEVMMALEEKFDVSIPEEEAQKIKTVQEVADAISNLKK